MKLKLTPSEVKTIPLPDTGKVMYWDTQLPRFGISATPGGKSYVVRARVGGGRLGRDALHTVGRCNEIALPAARTAAMKALAAIRSGTDLTKEKIIKRKKDKVQSTTLEQLLEHYLSTRQLRPRTVETYKDALRLCVPDWMAAPITSISRDMIETRLQEIADVPGERGDRKAQVKQCYTTLRALFRFAADRYEVNGVPLIQSMPTKNVAKGKSWSKPQVRDTIIHPDDLAKWWQATVKLGKEDPILRDYCQFLLYSGARRSETLLLKWEYIKGKDNEKVIEIPATIAKSGRKRLIPLTNELQAIIKRRHDSMVVGNPYIFPGTLPRHHWVEPRKAVRYVRKESKVDWTLHDLRRSYSVYAEDLISESARKALLGHSAGSDVTQAHYSPKSHEAMAQAAQKVADWIKQQCNRKEPADKANVS